jgi:hypothetical protein
MSPAAASAQASGENNTNLDRRRGAQLLKLFFFNLQNHFLIEVKLALMVAKHDHPKSEASENKQHSETNRKISIDNPFGFGVSELATSRTLSHVAVTNIFSQA